jgi:hypothetical protein
VTHHAQVYINTTLFPGNPASSHIENRSINQTEANALLRHLKNDAVSYIYSSIVSVGNAILSIRKELLTWATVKLYYATFYGVRSLLAINGVCIFYIKTSPTKTTPFILTVQAGQIAKKGNGQTHKLVLSEFRKRNNIEPRLLSQYIGLQDPLEWLIERREEANYKTAKFLEPQVPRHFDKIIDHGLRRVIKEYLCDTSDLYMFDPDHAILAYPLRGIQIACKKLWMSGDFSLKSDEISYLCQLFNDQSGPIPEMHALLKNL